MNRIYLDLETTGLESDSSIIEISARYYKGDKLVTSFDGKGFAEDAIINLDALKVNKYNLTKLNDLIPERQLLINFFDWILAIETKPELAGVNVQFDFNLLKARALKYNIKTGSVLPYRLHDITNISRFLMKIGLLEVRNSGSGNSLMDLANALGINFDVSTLHSAAGDTNLYYLVDKALEDLVKERIKTTDGCCGGSCHG